MRTSLIVIAIAFGVVVSRAGQSAPVGNLLAKRLAQLSAHDQSLVLISFVDKRSSRNIQQNERRALVSERSLRRRLRTRSALNLIDESDFPLDPSYVSEIGRHVVTLRHELKWFNAVSAIATKEQIERIRSFPFVSKIELVGRWKKRADDERETVDKTGTANSAPAGAASLDYGLSYTQVNQINVPALHNLGICGQGVTVGVFDNGFRLPSHEAFASMDIIAQYDFVDHKESVVPNNTSGGFGAHGVNTLSVIGGYKPGQLIGPAFKSSFILARTENDSSETPIEEDNWAKAIEWADSIGVDVTSTSLGYLTYDAPYSSWTFRDMDGATTLVTQAADHAAALGIVVVNSAGNDAIARSGDPNTLIAPADGFDVITAGAVNSSGTRASFSSYGPTFDGRTKPDVMAMGVNVRLASSSLTSGYVNGSGTSFSCPLVAGVAALLVCANPLLAPADIADALRETASNWTSPDNYYGWGIVNALDALNYDAILPLGKVRGKASIDIDGDGIIEGGEPPASGVKIILGGTMAESTTTDALGNFAFDSLAIGNYTLRQAPAPGWIQTFPETSFAFSLLHGADTSGFRFSGFKLGALHGLVFEDLDHDGVLDSGEAGLSGWRVRLFGPETLTVITDGTGGFGFSGLQTGVYVLAESSNAGWLQTFPPLNGSYSLTINSGADTSGMLFGNIYLPNSNYHVIDNWNLLSLPTRPPDARTTALYPTASTPAFRYAGSYKRLDSLVVGLGYWLKFNYAQNVPIPGDPIFQDTVIVTKGWNIVGGVSLPVAVPSIVQDPPGIVISNYYSYDGAYHTADSIRPHSADWVKVNGDGKLIMIWPSITGLPVPDQIMDDESPGNTITIEDAKGLAQELFVGGPGTPGGERYELPPLPPEGGFDVRFASQRSRESAVPGGKIPIIISGGTYPVRIRANFVEAGIRLNIDGRKISLSGAPVIELFRPPHIMEVQVDPSKGNSVVPRQTALHQNYPNPFNPQTSIAFGMKDAGFVTVKIYDVVGRVVATLVNEFREAGEYSVSWDAGGSPSGVYFYRMTAGAFTDVKKMVVLR